MLSKCALLTAAFVVAIAKPQSEPPQLARVEGKVYVNDNPQQQAGALPGGSVVRTAERSRAVIRLRGATLYVDESSAVRVAEQLEIVGGAAVLVTENGGSITAVCEDSVKVSDAGVFRFDVKAITPYGENECRLRVYKGGASVQLATVSTVLTSGQFMQLNRRCGDMIPRQPFNTKNIDGFDRWSREAAGRQ